MARSISRTHFNLGRSVRRHRRAAGLSQAELGDKSGLDRTYVGGVERGERNLSLTTLLKLTEALESSPAQLFAEAEREEEADRTNSQRREQND